MCNLSPSATRRLTFALTYRFFDDGAIVSVVAFCDLIPFVPQVVQSDREHRRALGYFWRCPQDGLEEE